MNERQKQLIIGGIVLFMGIWLIVLLCSNIPIWVTEHRVDAIARGEHDGPNVDWWGHAIHIKHLETPSGQVECWKATSDGPDSIAGTPDDISSIYFKINYAYAFGEWTAKQSKSFVKGAIQGLKSKD